MKDRRHYRTSNWSICRDPSHLWGVAVSLSFLVLVSLSSSLLMVFARCLSNEYHPPEILFQSRGIPMVVRQDC